MTPRQRRRARAELATAAAVLDRLAAFVDRDDDGDRSDPDRNGHLRYLWIVVGSRLKNYGVVVRAPRASGRLAGAVALRNKLAYAEPESVNDRRLWGTTVEHARPLATEISDLMAALEATD
jgi:hypothetical protein